MQNRFIVVRPKFVPTSTSLQAPLEGSTNHNKLTPRGFLPRFLFNLYTKYLESLHYSHKDFTQVFKRKY